MQSIIFPRYMTPNPSIPEKPKNKNIHAFKEYYPSCLQNLKCYLSEYSENTTIHGFKFLGERRRPWIEKVCWMLILLTSISFCVAFILKVYQKWLYSPVVVRFAASQTFISEIPFPAITICPSTKFNKTLFNYTDVYLKILTRRPVTSEEIEHFKYSNLLCLNILNDLSRENFRTVGQEAIDFMFQTALEIDENLFAIRWLQKGYSENLTNFFIPTLTSEGICYTFNMLDRTDLFTDIVKYPIDDIPHEKSSEWSLEGGYSLKNRKVDTFPRRTFISGTDGGFRLVFLVFKEHLDYTCKDYFLGLKVSLHHPAEFPRINQNYFLVSDNQFVRAAVKPKVMTTSTDTKKYKPEDRKCYFDKEKSLKFFKIYNLHNCVIECLANFTLRYCGCVSFYMPKEKSTPICGVSSLYCTEMAKVLFFTDKVAPKNEEILNEEEFNFMNISFKEMCDCLPSCYSLEYDMETSQVAHEWTKTFAFFFETGVWDETVKEAIEKEGMAFAIFEIFFKDQQFTTSERVELYGTAEFWANVGGVISLFMGFSFISVFETVYYLSLRIVCNIKMFGRRHWSGNSELLAKPLK